MQKEQEKTQKKSILFEEGNTPLKVVLWIVLALIIIGLAGYVTYVAFIKEEPEAQQVTTTKEENNSKFEIYYSFGVGEKNILDTKNNLYIKDMCGKPSKEYTMQLTESEKNKIHDSVTKNKLFDIKNDFTQNCYENGQCQTMTPLAKATLKIMSGNKIKTIKYSGDYININDPELKKLQNVENVIRNIISKKEKEMNIKQQDCPYL